jgi:hypothetical protein
LSKNLDDLLALVVRQIMLRDEVVGNNRHVRFHEFLHITLTTFAPQDSDLLPRRIDKDLLARTTFSLRLREGAMMAKAPRSHLADKRFMPAIQSFQLPLPPQRLRMPRIALLALREHRPNRVQLPMFAKQMVSAQPFRRDIPDTHYSSPVKLC